MAIAIAAVSCVRVYSDSTPLALEQRAPAFSLPDHRGAEVELDSILSERAAVLVFYRGRD